MALALTSLCNELHRPTLALLTSLVCVPEGSSHAHQHKVNVETDGQSAFRQHWATRVPPSRKLPCQACEEFIHAECCWFIWKKPEMVNVSGVNDF